jgi:ubiquitin carboxyl-terminal hydrolase 7
MQYGALVQKLAEHLGPDVQADHIRLSTVNAATGKPKGSIRHTTNHNLGTLLQPGYNSYGQAQNQRADAFYYEVLEVSLTELEQRKAVKITFLPEGITKEEQIEVLVPKAGNLDDVIAALQVKIGLEAIPDDKVSRIRVFEAHANKIYRELPTSWPVTNLSDFTALYAEIIPAGEMKGEYDEGEEGLVGAFQFDKDTTKPHGIPFYFLAKKGEKFSETKVRLQKRTGLKGKAFERIKFTTVARSAYGKMEYLEDGEFLSRDECFRETMLTCVSDDVLWDRATTSDISLGLDHTNKSRSIWNRAENIFIR